MNENNGGLKAVDAIESEAFENCPMRSINTSRLLEAGHDLGVFKRSQALSLSLDSDELDFGTSELY